MVVNEGDVRRRGGVGGGGSLTVVCGLFIVNTVNVRTMVRLRVVEHFFEPLCVF